MMEMTLTVSRRQHIRHAAFLWLMVGTFLGVHGMMWLLADAQMHRLLAIIIPGAAVVGILKGAVLLRKSAVAITRRIHGLDERTPFWQLFSPATYLLVLGMMGIGITCRVAGTHWHVMGIIGILYVIIGIALITGSRTYWAAAMRVTG